MLTQRFLFLLLLYPLPCTLLAQEETFTFEALVRIDGGSPTPVEVEVPANQKKVVEVGAGYRLEFDAPLDGSGTVNVLLSRQQNGSWLPQYTLRRALYDEPLPRLGFLVCGGIVRPLVPVPEEFPACYR